MNALVNPHPGQCKPNKIFQIQGIQRSIPFKALSVVEKKK